MARRISREVVILTYFQEESLEKASVLLELVKGAVKARTRTAPARTPKSPKRANSGVDTSTTNQLGSVPEARQ